MAWVLEMNAAGKDKGTRTAGLTDFPVRHWTCLFVLAALCNVFASAGLFLVVGGVSLPNLARAETVTLFKGAIWEAAAEQEKFYGVSGQAEASTSNGPKSREFAFFFDVKERRFGILVEKENLRSARGAVVPVVLSFKSAQPSKPLPQLRFIARVATGQVRAFLSDSEVPLLTHNFTAGVSMTVSFPSQDGEQWTFDLTGTTPSISAMAAAIGAAGIIDLPPPWRVEGYGAALTTTQPPVNPSMSQADRESQNRQLAIARAEAEKARADADRASAEAQKARADADRARAEAQISVAAKEKADEEARANIARAVSEQRRKALQEKVERDAKGSEP